MVVTILNLLFLFFSFHFGREKRMLWQTVSKGDHSRELNTPPQLTMGCERGLPYPASACIIGLRVGRIRGRLNMVAPPDTNMVTPLVDTPHVNGVHTPVIEPGNYRITELAEILSVSRTTIERYIQRYSLETARLSFQNKVVRGVHLDEEKAALLSQLIGMGERGSYGGACTGVTPPGTTMGERGMTPLAEQVETLQEQVHQLEIERARLETELKRIADLERLIESKDSEISTLKTSLLILERKASDPVTVTSTTSKPVGLIGKIRQWLGT